MESDTHARRRVYSIEFSLKLFCDTRGWKLMALAITIIAFILASGPGQGTGFCHLDRSMTTARRADGRHKNSWNLSSVHDRYLSSAERERREEERRRKERANDVVIGKTSALQGVKDFELNVRSTEEQWLSQASPTEREVFHQTEKGIGLLKMLRIEEASEAFNTVFELKPSAYLWQAGIARYYLGDLDGAAEIFARCGGIYESRFGDPASEERIWRNACFLKKFYSLKKKEQKALEDSGDIHNLLSNIPERENTTELLKSERRKVIKLAQTLFSSTVHKQHSEVILAHAKLRSIGGAYDEQPKMDRKMWKMSSWFYLGLYHDAMGEHDESKRCMKMALRLSPNAHGDDLMHTLPMLHMTCRDWFDDEEFDDDKISNQSEALMLASNEHLEKVVPENADPHVVESMQSSLEKMRLVDLQNALRIRGLRAVGSKAELQARLFDSLMSDVGLTP
jgi:tetratricopeptide (TPR) repeat protein